MITPYSIAKKYVGRKEVAGVIDDNMIMEWLRLDNQWPEHDEVPWCSAFVNWVMWQCDLPRTKSLLARSWLGIGDRIIIDKAEQGFDIVVLKRGDDQPGPENTKASGHVGLYAFHYGNVIYLLGGNQDNSVSIKPFSIDRVLGIRRLI